MRHIRRGSSDTRKARLKTPQARFHFGMPACAMLHNNLVLHALKQTDQLHINRNYKPPNSIQSNYQSPRRLYTAQGTTHRRAQASKKQSPNVSKIETNESPDKSIEDVLSLLK